MTESVPGSSLLQARDGHASQKRRQHHHHHHARSHGHAALHRRQEVEEDASVVQIIQTVNIVQIIDEAGATVEIQTSISEPTTTTISPASEDNEPTLTDEIVPETPTPTTSPGDDVADLLSSITSTIEPSLDLTASLSMSSSFPTVESFASITPSAHFSSSTGFPTLSGAANSTAFYSNSTASLRAFNLTSTQSLSSGTILFNSSLTTTIDSSETTSTFSFTSDSPYESATSTNANGFFGGTNGGTGATGAGQATNTASGNSSSSSTETPPATVAGSVLGAVAGVALILVAALFLLRYKKRQNALRLRGSDSGARGLLTEGGAGGAPPSMGEMSQQRSVPFVVPAALANLTGNKRFSRQTTSSSDGERGFQKVAGRKLPSVLQHGGDGFTDPALARASHMTDETCRDSVAIFEGRGMPRLAVGSPMRPESGIPIYHEGPARTPVTEQGRFAPRVPGPRSDSPTLVPPPPQRDPLGRSLPSLDGSNRSHGSASRFSEHL